MNLQENISRIKQMMGLLTEGLHDTYWQNEEGDKITLIDLLDATQDIPVEEFSVEELSRVLRNLAEYPAAYFCRVLWNLTELFVPEFCRVRPILPSFVKLIRNLCSKILPSFAKFFGI